ncbi:MAG: bifunctional DNA-formamidopyrimidine glycosylase/DNA-(apurinic or apyrimidinic site) lyase [Candidatus Poseidoniales archaeon]|nr:MAG: bifunctional DNA-formamidopyrimidine glycosylase/DNA-(apurinic or apyrimidinic site) lyase [Candidatus Poseidoniales archaeon]
MPELPEVETVRQGLLQGILNKTVSEVLIRREGLRYPFPKDLVTVAGCTVTGIRRRAKYLLIDLDDGRVLLSHLGMSGRYTLFSSTDAEAVPQQLLATVNGGVPVSAFGDSTGYGGKHDHLEFIFTDGTRAVYTDPRRFGIVDLFPSEEEAIQPLLSSLGPEPFDPWSAVDLARALQRRKTAIKLALLDQKTVVGVGNIYACEALHRSGISPTRKANGFVRANGKPTVALERLTDHIKEVLSEAIASGGSTLNDFAAVDGTMGYFAHAFQVYGREGLPCTKEGCGGVVRRLVQSNRSTFHCPSCQR